MKKVVFLLEEPSMKEFLDEFLPRLLPGLDFVCVRHEGKQDLEKSIPRKIKGWYPRDVAFVVVRDNDGAACKKLKDKLKKLCVQAGRPDALVRIACQELEAWFLGSLAAVGAEYAKPALSKPARRERFRDPDLLPKPSLTLRELVPEYQKLDGARRMGGRMPVQFAGNRSRSFQVFCEGVQRLAAG